MPGWGGHQGNAWNNAATGAGGVSPAFRTSGGHNISASGDVSGATTIALDGSHDKINWQELDTAVLAGAGEFNIEHVTAHGWVRLRSTAAVTATATITGRK